MDQNHHASHAKGSQEPTKAINQRVRHDSGCPQPTSTIKTVNRLTPTPGQGIAMSSVQPITAWQVGVVGLPATGRRSQFEQYP
jgi:hypothetical protein